MFYDSPLLPWIILLGVVIIYCSLIPLVWGVKDMFYGVLRKDAVRRRKGIKEFLPGLAGEVFVLLVFPLLTGK